MHFETTEVDRSLELTRLKTIIALYAVCILYACRKIHTQEIKPFRFVKRFLISSKKIEVAMTYK